MVERISNVFQLIVVFHFTLCQPCSFPTQTAPNGYATYRAGNSPIIILSQHGGSLKPSSIPDRLDGCWTGTKCDWMHNCTNTHVCFSDGTEHTGNERMHQPRDSSKCEAKTLIDSHTKTIATCLAERTNLTINGMTLTPHLVINQLHRSDQTPQSHSQTQKRNTQYQTRCKPRNR